MQTKFIEGDSVYVAYKPVDRNYLVFYGPIIVKSVTVEVQRIEKTKEWRTNVLYTFNGLELRAYECIVFSTFQEAINKLREIHPKPPDETPPQEKPA